MKRIMIFIVFIFISINSLSAHFGSTHEYIVVEAWKLLKKQLCLDIPELEDRIGGINQCRGLEFPFAGWVTAGAYQEDQYDPIWLEHRVPLLPPIPTLIDKRHLASVHHFWRPDQPNDPVKFNYPQGTPFYFKAFAKGPWPNARAKAMLYANNGDNDYDQLFIHTKGEYNGCKFINIDCFGPPDNDIDLIEYYLIGDKMYWYGQYNECYQRFAKFEYYREIEENILKNLTYNILGRICHLLGDASIPAHVHMTYHGPLCLFCDEHTDWYENWMKYENEEATFWDHDKILNERGGFINPFCNQPYGTEPYHNNRIDHPVEYLMYTTGQIADYFASRGECGNATYDHDIGEISSILQNDNLPGPKLVNQYIDNNYPGGGSYNSDYNYTHIREATFPYVIRATAGLLYWFLVEAKLIDPDEVGERGTVPGQIENLELWKEITIAGNHYTFLADEKITVCPDGYEQEEEEGPFTIDETAKNVTFKAGGEIIFKDGFVAKRGSDVHAYTSACTKCPDEDKNPKY